jgi:hypothetical protein
MPGIVAKINPDKMAVDHNVVGFKTRTAANFKLNALPAQAFGISQNIRSVVNRDFRVTRTVSEDHFTF